MTSTLTIQNLTKTYEVDNNTITAVDDVSFGLRGGEFVALVGPSGSGKTSLLAMIAGLLRPTAGNIGLDGMDLSHMSDGQRTEFRRRNIGFTFQSNNLVPYLNVQQNVELMLHLNNRHDRAGQARAVELLKRLGLGERLHNLPSQLSGGQQQRVAIARSLIHDPALVLADEPTASLDTELAFQVVSTFADLIHEQQRIGIMVTHDLRMCRFVDAVVQMQDGRLQRVLRDKDEIEALAGGGYAALQAPKAPAARTRQNGVPAGTSILQPELATALAG
jgi:putative ABC transport system ATP-binding protein